MLLKYLSEHDSSPFRRICLRCPAIVMYDVLTEKILTAEDLAGLAAGVIAGYFNPTVSITILACVVAHSLISMGFAFYYGKKY